jgi:hypothetical protein
VTTFEIQWHVQLYCIKGEGDDRVKSSNVEAADEAADGDPRMVATHAAGSHRG